jgi:RimJ/RimL family protein N-acetyltransferase
MPTATCPTSSAAASRDRATIAELSSAVVLETPRLVIRRMSTDDAPFVLALLNEPSFIQHIGDKGVRTLDDARAYITSGPLASYARHGFGLYLVALRETAEAIGMCGLLKRDYLPDPDLGFAFLPRFWSKGFAYESATAVLAYARDVFVMERVAAIVSPGNAASIGLLEKLGFVFERRTRLQGSSSDVKLFAIGRI